MSDMHRILDTDYDEAALRGYLETGGDADARGDMDRETLLGVAARRRRVDAARLLLDAGADPDLADAHGKTPYVHAVRRGFGEVARLLRNAGASPVLTTADLLAVALTEGSLDDARALIAADPGCVRTGNPGEDRLLADLAGRADAEPVRLLVQAGADLRAAGLDGGTPLHQAAWFGQPVNLRILLDAGAPVDVFDPIHHSSPLHWAVHGSRYSGDAEHRQDAYVEITRSLLAAGSRVSYPEPSAAQGRYEDRLLRDATPAVRAVLEEFGVTGGGNEWEASPVQ